MNAARLIREARTRARLTLRELAERASTSHSALAAYESGRKSPNVTTLERILGAAGFGVDVELHPRVDRAGRGDELIAVLDLAEAFPARHHPTIEFPPFRAVAHHG